ncbi:hypothetical protein D9M69_693950 [compost metagenome]
MLALASAQRSPGSPAMRRNDPIERAVPMHRVCTGAVMYCMVSYMARPLVMTPPGELMYRWIGFVGFSDSRNSNCAQTSADTASLTSPFRKMMRSRSSRE